MNRKILPISLKADGSFPHLSTLMGEIPTNTILCKTLTGLGATYCECKAKRNSIIIEPNLPVILGKCSSEVHKDDCLFGVYKGVVKKDIVKYVKTQLEEGKYIKILTTPESFDRVESAIKDCHLDVRSDFFLLFDECHKVIQDNDYRSTVTLPFDTFFACENKALVSATPMDFSDERYEEENFTMCIIEPDFDYTKVVNIVQTNSVAIAVPLDSNAMFLFCNSITLIETVINSLNIKEESKIFCSKNSCDTLSADGFTNYADNWDGTYSKYNFFTSRFYNAFDIELEFRPKVILLSDARTFDSTLLDPSTDVRQIVGRFRNGVESVTHIYQTNENYISFTHEEICKYVDTQLEIYNYIHTLWSNATSNATAHAYRSAYQALPPHKWHRWKDDNFILDRFLVDNYIADQYLHSVYSSSDRLISEYKNTKGLVMGNYEEFYCEQPVVVKKSKIVDTRKKIVSTLLTLEDSENDRKVKEDLRRKDEFIVNAFDVLGAEEIKRLRFNRKSIKEAMLVKHSKEQLSGNEVILTVKNSFQLNTWYSCSFIKTELQRIYKLFNIISPKAITAKSITDFFEVKESKRKNERGYVIVRSLV